MFRNKRESSHPLFSVASLRVKKDIEELTYKRYLAGYADVYISIPYFQGIYICMPVSYQVKSDCGSMYSNAVFNCIIKITPGYPFKPPELWVLNKVYHPNIDIDTGHVFLRILRDSDWKPVLTLNSIIFAFESLIYQPDLSYLPENPTNIEMKQVYLESFEQFKWRIKATLNGGVFYDKYLFLQNYGEYMNSKRVKSISHQNTKKLKKDHQSMNIDVRN